MAGHYSMMIPETYFHFWSIVGALTYFGWLRMVIEPEGGKNRDRSLLRRLSDVSMRNTLNLLFWRGVLQGGDCYLLLLFVLTGRN